MHFIVDPGPAPDVGEKLQLLQSSGPGGYAIISEHPLVKPGPLAFARNVRGYQPPEMETQFTAGDARAIIGERTVDIIVHGTSVLSAHQALAQLDAAFDLTIALRYAGVTTPVSGMRGITGTQPINGGKALRVTIAYYPTTQASVDDADQPVLGPI